MPVHFETVGVLTGTIYDVRVYPSAEGISVYWMDITERKRAAERFDRQQQTNQTLLQAVSDLGNGVALANAKARLVFVNEAFCRIVGYTTEELLNIPSTWALIPPEDRATLQARYQQRVRGEPVPENADLTLIRKDGSRVNVELAIKTLADNEGVQFIIIARDITERKQSEAQIEELNRDLERQAAELQSANAELESFSYSVSHDLRTPLASMDNLLRLLLDDYGAQLPESGQRVVHLIQENSSGMYRLIEDLLAFARSVGHPLNTQTINMTEIARQVFQELASAQPDRQVDFRISELPAAQADPVLLKQVWVNLLSNALKFTRGRAVAKIEVGSGKLEVGSETSRVSTSDFALSTSNFYYVKDNGAGFDMAQADKLFGVFQRLHGEEEFEGTGVGLAIVQRIIHRHGGRVWAEAAGDQGAGFYFTLERAALGDSPNAAPSSVQRISPESQPVNRKETMIRVLVVDDHQLFRQGLQLMLLKANDIQIVGEARDGKEAIELAQSVQPDVILMDIEMPGMNGLEATETLKAMGHPARILMLTMKTDERDVRAA
ncbi:MAG: hypothetical protein A2Z03_10320, partial [Chloroflexi bacterium RBG_16_56_8]